MTPTTLTPNADQVRGAVDPDGSFHRDDSGDQKVRLSCSCLERDQIVEGFRRLAAFLSALS